MKAFGVTVTRFEEEMVKLISEVKSGGDPASAALRAIQLMRELSLRVHETITYIARMEEELLRELEKAIEERVGHG